MKLLDSAIFSEISERFNFQEGMQAFIFISQE